MEKIKERIYKLLRWSERYTKTDMIYLVSGGSWLTGSQILVAIAGFLATVVFGLYLSKEEYGNYRYVLSVFAVLSAFTLTGLNTAVVQSVASGFDGALKQGFRLGMKWSIFAVLGSLVGASYYLYKDNTFLGYSLVLVALALPFFNSAVLYGGFLNGKKDFKKFSLFSFIDNILPLIAVVVTVYFTNKVINILLVYFISNILIRYLLYIYTNLIYKPQENKDPGLAEYSIKLSALNIIGTVTAHIDKVLIFTSLGATELAIYGFASAFPDRIRSLLKNLNTLMVPKFSENINYGKRMDFKRKTFFLGFVIIIITVTYITLAPYLYALFFPNYPESVTYSRILALMILSSIAMIPLSLFIAQKNEDKYAKATIGGSLLQIAMLIPAIYFYGLMGVVITKVIGSYLIAGISYYLVKNQTN